MSARDTAGFSPAARTVIVGAAVAIAVIGMHLARDVLTPALLALVIVLTVLPLRQLLIRRGAPVWVAACAMIVVACLVLLGIVALIVLGLVQFVDTIDDYSADFVEAAAWVTSGVESLGLGELVSLSTFDPVFLASTAAGLAGWVVSLIVTLGFVVVYIVFMSFDVRLFGDVARRFASSRATTIGAFSRYAGSVRRYYIVNTIFGALVAICDGLILWWIGVPGAAAWAVLAFVTNYIPSIGFVIGLVPPVILALITGGWGMALLVLAVYCVVNVVLQTFVQPKFVSDAVRLNLTLTFFSVVFWTAVLGPMGAILSIPMTLLVRTIVLETGERQPFARWITGDRADE